ncbi:MAG: hypothetical protein KME20_25490 [Kaiparowitsia implicata GSE-PSE-MK54-09C]|jgi:hypothetical protein|nr:hypothetical protein [Kaiparowitsia implicata GSE-PSE-MK54-09C]
MNLGYKTCALHVDSTTLNVSMRALNAVLQPLEEVLASPKTGAEEMDSEGDRPSATPASVRT